MSGESGRVSCRRRQSKTQVLWKHKWKIWGNVNWGGRKMGSRQREEGIITLRMFEKAIV